MARALTLVPGDSREAGRLLSPYGGHLGVGPDYEGAQRALGRAIAIANREGDVVLELQTLAQAASVSLIHLHWQECIEMATGEESCPNGKMCRTLVDMHETR